VHIESGGQLATIPASRTDFAVAGLVVVLFTVVGLLTIEQYGLTWDEPENLVVGERYLAFFLTRDVTLLDFSRPRPEVDNPDGLHLRLLSSYAHPPLPNIVAAVTGRVLGRWAGWLDPVDARHAAIVTMGGLVLGVTYLFARETLGRPAAVLAILALALFPRFVGHAHYNLKDIPKTLLFAVTLWGLWRGVTFRRPAWIAGAGLVLGAGLSVRPNLAVAAVVGLLWVGIRFHQWWCERRVRLAILAFPLTAAVGFVAAWPAMWVTPVETVRRLWEYWMWLGLSGRQEWTFYPLLMLAFTTPLPTLVLACWGVVGSIRLWRDDEHRSLTLLLLWLGLPLVRASMPGMNIYDGIRHFLEVAPALAMLSALGAEEAVWLVEGAVRRMTCWVARVVVVLLFLPALFDLVRFAPYEIAYFNRLIGGLSGAQAAGVQDATDYWGTSYRRGFAWLSEHAPYGAALYMPLGQQHLAVAVHGLWLREDVVLISEGEAAAGPVYVTHTTRPTEYSAVDWYCRSHLEPVYVIEVDSAPVLEVFRLSPEEWGRAEGGGHNRRSALTSQCINTVLHW